MERTLSIIKPDAVSAGKVGEIIAVLERHFRVVALRMVYLCPAEAGAFYEVHRERPFFPDLVAFMSSGPCVALVLEGEDAIARYRALMGPTDPTLAPEGTLRHLFATNTRRNAVHGSDSPASASEEIRFFFAERDLVACG